MALLFVAGLSSLLLAWRHDRGQSGRRLLRFAIGANLVALLLAFQFGFVGFMQRVEEQGIEDLRWPVAQVTSQAAIANLPFGSGFGTFVPVYEKFAPRTLLGETLRQPRSQRLAGVVADRGGSSDRARRWLFGMVSRLDL